MTAVIDPLLTTYEVAALLRKRPRTVDSWREPGSTVALPFVRIAGQPRYRKADVQKFIDDSVCTAAPLGFPSEHRLTSAQLDAPIQKSTRFNA